MKRIIHISDLHFGRVNPLLIDPLLGSITEQRPDIVAVSGDLTQRATEAQFKAARDFLRRIPFPLIVVPGNHDISLWNIYRRFARPLERYHRHIGEESGQSYYNDRLFVFGLNTASSFKFKEGRISIDQLTSLREQFCVHDPQVFKVLVVHHPFVPPSGATSYTAIDRGEEALRVLEDCSADLILAGHLHQSFTQQTKMFYRVAERSILVVQSGTTLSERTREELNSFNVIDVEPDAVRITVNVWEAARGRFVPGHPVRYQKRGEWRRVDNDEKNVSC